MSTPETDPKFEALLEYLERTRGFDFSGYKRTSLMRRIHRRMETVGLADYEQYIDFLEVHPEEFALLFNTILINVTAFFRDPPAWEYLRQSVLPPLIASGKLPIRIWCASVASGEEAYTATMLFAEAMGEENFTERIKIYATDIDTDALAQARQASYPPEALENVPPEMRERYFELVEGRYVFRQDLRRAVIFGRNDIIQDAPISHLDLLICRNTLMYFNLETQSRILNRFRFALNEGGVLFLGKAEMLLTHTNLFTPLELRHRIFARSSAPDTHNHMMLVGANGNPEGNNHRVGLQTRLRDAALDAEVAAQIVVDMEGRLVLANNRARTLFHLGAKDIGRPFYELEVSYRPVELRSKIEQAYADRGPITMTDVERRLSDQNTQFLDVDIRPLFGNDATTLGVSISFTETTRYHELQEEVHRSKQDLETAYEELQSANEELETTNEELQSTVEELQTTNEELQSSNEELETMNEELQSSNEELEATNAELRQRTEQLDEASAFQMSILDSLEAGVIVVDRNMNVVGWNSKAEDLWGLRIVEVQRKSLFNLDIGLPVDKLGGSIRAALASGEKQPSFTVEAMNRRGKAMQCRIACSPMRGLHKDERGAIVMIEELDKHET